MNDMLVALVEFMSDHARELLSFLAGLSVVLLALILVPSMPWLGFAAAAVAAAVDGMVERGQLGVWLRRGLAPTAAGLAVAFLLWLRLF